MCIFGYFFSVNKIYVFEIVIYVYVFAQGARGTELEHTVMSSGLLKYDIIYLKIAIRHE